MKQYIPIIFLIILITSCAPVIDIEEAQPVEETPTEEPIETPEEVILEEPKTEESSEENIIEVGYSFSPAEKTIQKGTEIKWIKKDTRNYKIACYLKGTRITQSPDLKQGDTFTYTFLENGKYTCITTPYGLRNVIAVEESAPLLSPTGNIVIGNIRTKGNPLAAIALIAIISLLAFVYRKRK